MKTIFLVKQEEAELARRMEQKLIDLPISSGVLFAGVSITKGELQPTYNVWIGCHRTLEESLMTEVVRATLKEEIEAGANIQVSAHRGLSREVLKSVD